MKINLHANTESLENFKLMLDNIIRNIDTHQTLGNNTNEGVITFGEDKIYFSIHNNEIKHEQYYGC